MPAPICFLDTETDGIHPTRKPWEIAIVRREPDGTETEWQAFVAIDLSTADPFGLRVGRFYDRHPLGRYLAGDLDAPPWPMSTWPDSQRIDYGAPYVALSEVAPIVARMTHAAHIVGAVPDFDAEILARLLREHTLTPAWHYHLQDVETLAVGYLRAKGIRLGLPWDSDELTERLGLEPVPAGERHTAMGDVRWVMRIYDKVMSPD
jgi:hypothetical protein